MNTPLQQAAQAMIDRWDSPTWKDQPHTAEYIAEIRKALNAELQQAVEPVAWLLCEKIYGLDQETWNQRTACLTKFNEDCEPLYLHPPQPQPIEAPHMGRKPLTPQEIRDWWASENKLEDCNMCKLHDFETVVRAIEAAHGITSTGKGEKP